STATNAAASQLRPAVTASSCGGRKLAALAERTRFLGTAYGKRRKTPDEGRLSTTTATFQDKLARDFAKIESREGHCLTTQDADRAEAATNVLLGNALEKLWPLAAAGITFTVPSGWALTPALFAMSNGESIELTNFGGEYDEGGIIPPGGGVINIT